MALLNVTHYLTYKYILLYARRSVPVIPRSDAEAREHPIHQPAYAVITGFRVGARNDSYRPLGLRLDGVINRTYMVHPQFWCITYRCQSRPRRGRTMLNRMWSDRRERNLRQVKTNKTVPEGGEQQDDIRPLRGRYYWLHTYRKFRFATHAVKHNWTSSRPYYHKCQYT